MLPMTALSPSVAVVWEPVGCLWTPQVVPQAPPSRLTPGRLPWHPCCLLGRLLGRLLLVRDGEVGGLEDAGEDGVLDDLPVGGGGLLGEVELAPRCWWRRRGALG